MFIIDITYTVSLDELDNQLTAHRSYLDKYYALNIFIASGRKEPRTGGIILALAADKAVIENIIQEDPFYICKLATYTVTEFIPTKYHPAVKDLLE
jgi:uncharacterized protein YciI